MAQELRLGRKRDKVKAFLGLRQSRTPQPPESHFNPAAASSPNAPLPQPQVEGNVPSLQQAQKIFAKGESFKKDMAVLSIAYTLQESPELKKLIRLIVEIRDNDSEGQLTAFLETCTRFSVELSSATDAHRAEATQAITAFNETVEKIRTIQLNDDGKSLEELTSTISQDIERIKPSFVGNGDVGTTDGLSKVLDITIGPTIGILDVIKEATSLIPVPWVHPLIGTVVSMLQAVSQTRANYKEMKQIAVTAGEFVVSCAVICSERAVGPILEGSLKKLYKALKSVAEECDKLSQLNRFSRYLQQSGHMGDLQAIRQGLIDAIQLFQTENSINVKLDTEELNRKIDFASLNNLPSHPRYTRNEYFENSRDDVLQHISDWVVNGPETVLWVHGAVGLGKSTVAQELVHVLKSEDRFAGGVFLTNLTDEPPERVIQMISRQLGQMYPRAIANIADAARKLDGPHDKLRDYFAAYIFDPIRALEYSYQLVCVVDGLDEWHNYGAFLAELVHIPLPSPVKFVLTSRFNYSIERAVDKIPTCKYPLPLASQTVIEQYFHYHFISGDINWRGRKPDGEIIRRLAALAGGLLIWAATVRLLVMNRFDTRYPHVILDQIFTLEETVVGQKDGTKDGQLERLYSGAISTLFPPHIRGTLRKFLAATIVLQDALLVADFAHLTGIPETATEEIHQRLAALQTQGDPKTTLITPATQRFHISFVEFITTAPVDNVLQEISSTEAHCMLANRCLDIVFVELLPSFRGKTCLYSELRGVEPYAIKFWPLHLSNGTTSQPSAPPGCRVDMDIISEEAMRRWAIFFLPCIANRFQDGHDSLDNIERVDLPHEIAMMIGLEDLTTLSYHIQCLIIATQLHPLHLETWTALGIAYKKLYLQSQSIRDLDEAVNAFRHGLQPATHPDRSLSLYNLATALWTRFERQGASTDLDEAILLHQDALLLRPAPHPDRSRSLNNLAISVQTRFEQRGASNDLDNMIFLHQEALLLRPAPHPDRFISLNNLANALRNRFEQRGASNDLDEAIFLHRESLLLVPVPHPDRSISLNNLGWALQTRFEQRGASNDLDEAISLHQEAILRFPAPHPDHSMSLNNLAVSLQTRFKQQGASNDLDNAISLHREVLLLFPAPHPDRFKSLNNLATALQTCFEQRGASDDLDEAISLHKEALLSRPAPHPDRSMSLNNLANSLETRFKQRGASNDLDDAIFLHREALLLRPAPQSDRSSSLNNLATALQTRFEMQGTSTDLGEAISLHREALLLSPAPHPSRSISLTNLSWAFLTRFEQEGASNDLDEAISLHQEALLLCPATHPRYSTLLKHLTISLQIRFDHGHRLQDLTETISLYERLLERPVEDPNRSWALELLPAALRERDGLIGDQGDNRVEGANA